MAEKEEPKEELDVIESNDGSATVEVPDNLLADDFDGNSEGGTVKDSDDDHPDDNDELRTAKRNRRRAKKDLIRKTNQEKDVRLHQLQRANDEMQQRISQLERNTKSEHIVKIDKGMEDAQTRLEYAKMKLAQATQNQDGEAMVEAQTLWQDSQEEMRNLANWKRQAERELKAPRQVAVDPDVKRNAEDWMKKNNWYRPDTSDADSKVAKKVDEIMATQGWNPADPDYWDELDSRLQKELPHRYNGGNDNDSRNVRRPRNIVGSSGREASAAYGGSNRSQFVLSPDRVKAMKDAGAWENPERKARMIKNFIAFDKQNRN